jgi:hypothetical protein
MAEPMNILFPGSVPERPCGALRVAFVAGNRNPARFREDPSFVYRCENLGLALQAAGHQVHLLHWTALRPAQRFDVVVFHRPRWSLRWRTLLWWLHRCGTTLTADVDDLVFDVALAQYSPGVLNKQVPLQQTQRLFASHCRALACFQRLTVSTLPLAGHVRERFPLARVVVLPNAVHQAWRGGAADPETNGSRPVVTYLSGTRSHDRDFALYADGVARFLAAHPAARLEVTGPLQFSLPARPGQVVHHPKVPFAQYVERVRSAWVNLAPLEATPFTRCKSALKVLEAGFWGAPTICSPLPDAERFAAAGAVFAANGEECFASLQALLAPSRYAAVTRGLREGVLALADVGRVAESFLQFVGVEPAGRR